MSSVCPPNFSIYSVVRFVTPSVDLPAFSVSFFVSPSMYFTSLDYRILLSLPPCSSFQYPLQLSSPSLIVISFQLYSHPVRPQSLEYGSLFHVTVHHTVPPGFHSSGGEICYGAVSVQGEYISLLIESYDGRKGKQKLPALEPTPTLAQASPRQLRRVQRSWKKYVPGATARGSNIKPTTVARQWGTQHYKMDCIKNGRKTASNNSVMD